MVAALTFLGLIVLRVALLTLGGLLLVRPVRRCPACFRPTDPVLILWLERMTRFEWRWCTGCGWRGLARRDRQAGRA
ncbi:MAG TPA: hypothetical protein VMM12_04700 [Longimicrobiales bacterium]|nr:hypothetical protein [Longimicrobiales bacterium]